MAQSLASTSDFRWDVALTRLCQRIPDLAEQSDIVPLLAQKVGALLLNIELGLIRRAIQMTCCTRYSGHAVSVLLQATVDSSVSAQVLARYLLKPQVTLAVADCFRPVLLELVCCLLDEQNACATADHAAYYIAMVQILEVAPHLERCVNHRTSKTFV